MSETSSLLNHQDGLLFVTDREPVVMSRGEGMYLWDTSGKKYLDFLGGWAVDSLGHSPDAISQALCEQSKTLVNASPSFFNEPMLKLAALLTDVSCLDRVFFCSTGSEANESAIKLARKFGSIYKNGAAEILSTEKSFHGRTLATMAATGKAAWRGLFAPEVSGFRHVPFNDIHSMEAAFSENTVAVIIEPIQGEGGVNEASHEYLSRIRRLCSENNALLILDEIQTGIARTGTLFAYERYGIEPDIMTLGKGLGGGFPVAAMLCKENLNIFEKGEQGGTYTGQPLAMAVAMAVVSHIIDGRIVDNVKEMGDRIVGGLHTLARRFPIRNVRGRGLLLAFDLSSPVADRLRSICFGKGLIVNSPSSYSIRLVPPLIVDTNHIAEMESILTDSLEELFA